MLISKKPFLFIRHGETEWNQKHLHMGTQDIVLSPKGIQQAHEAASVLASQDFQFIVTSPLSRAYDTAKIIATSLNKPMKVMNNFRQCCWGVIEGNPFDGGKVIHEWLAGQTPEGAESQQEFDTRVLIGLQNIFKMGGTGLIVAHGGVHRAIGRLTNLPISTVEHCKPYRHDPPIEGRPSWQMTLIEDAKSALSSGLRG